MVAVVVSYNSAHELPACLASLQAQSAVSTEVHVVDNASHDDSVTLIRRDFPAVRLTANRVNAGFAGGNNQILESIPADFYALVNPDTVLPPGALAACVAAMRSHPRVGVAATRLVNPDGSLQPSCHAFLGLRNLFGETFGIHRLLPGLRSLSSLHMPWFAHDRAAEVDWIQGAFLVVRGEVVRTVGGFDPAFFMYGEEMEWCRRMRGAGWSALFLPEPAVVHLGGASSKPVAGAMFVENLKGRLRFLAKHRGPFVLATARALIAVAVLLRFAWRETRALATRATGRPFSESDRLGLSMFRAATMWVLRGLPVGSVASSHTRTR
ncbi:MAG TPA: glycosyltransferase family 2 protein [Candidatus Eisenbacteria bacterium]|nr:glycosyltransferase family 2 protein [Candidatus Eisenbacteria bacterium]